MNPHSTSVSKIRPRGTSSTPKLSSTVAIGRIVVTRTQLLSDERPEDASAERRARSDRMRRNAAQLSAIHERWLQAPVADRDKDWNIDAQKAAGIVWEYIEHGSRRRLRVYLERIAREVPTGLSPSKDIRR